MNIIYYGYFSEWHGYATAARDYVELLEAAGHNVFCRNLQNHQNLHAFGQKWIARCHRPAPPVIDVGLVHKAPWNQPGIFENIDIFPGLKTAKLKVYYTVFETDLWPRNWLPILKDFDLILTPSGWQASAAGRLFEQNRFSKPVKVVPHVVTPIKDFAPPSPDDPYTLYSEFSRISHRKGFDILAKAYFDAFEKNDNTRLRVKTIPQSAEALHQALSQARNCFAFKNLPPVEINTCLYPDDASMDRLYNGCHAYVCAARGEGFGMSSAKAVVSGIPTILPYDGAPTWHSEYSDTQPLYTARSVPVCTDEFFNVGLKIDTEGMKWLEPDQGALTNKLRLLYGDRREKKIQQNHDPARAYLSPAHVTELLLKVIGG